MSSLKMALLRSEGKLKAALSRLLHHFKAPPSHPFSMLSIEQDHQLVDQNVFSLHPELGRTGRLFFQVALPNIAKERLRCYLRDVEVAALKLGIPLKMQQVVKTIFEKTPLAIEHNHLLMQLMQQMGKKYELACLFHEKPFVDRAGSAKKCSWTIYTDQGENLLSDTSSLAPTLLQAFRQTIGDYGALLFAAVASAGNEERLFFPHTVSYGQEGFFTFAGGAIHTKALGASMDPTLFFTLLQATLAESLELFLDQMADPVEQKPPIYHIQEKKGYYALQPLTDKKTIRVLDGVLSREDLRAVYEGKIKEYVEAKERETEFFETPEIQKIKSQMADLGWEAKGKIYSDLITPKIENRARHQL